MSVGLGNPTLRNTPVDSVEVVLSEPIVPGSFNSQAIRLTLNGGPNLITSGVTVTEINPTTYSIGGLDTLTTADGIYELTVSAGGLVDGSGNPGVGFLSEAWTMNTVGPTVASLPTYIQSPRNIVVPTIDVIFSEPIVPSTFTYQDITYSKAGGPNLITPGITITQLSPTEFAVSNFNNLLLPIDGTYTFTIDAAGVMDLAGNTGTGSASDSWTLITTPPAAPTGLAITPNTGVSAGLTDTGMVTLTGTLPTTGLLVDVMDGNTDLGFATVTGASFSISLDLPNGANQLEVAAVDAAGNVSPATTFSVFVNMTPPEITSIAAVAPNPRNTPVGSVDVTFSKAINLNTFTATDLTLADDGGPNLITGAVTITLVSGTTSTYEIAGLAGLTTAEGTYTLTVEATGIEDQAGNLGIGSLSTSWLMDKTPPTSTVGSLPAQTTSTSILVSASGNDPDGSDGSAPSGIASFALYVSKDGGAFSLFATVTPADPSALFTGQAGNTYGFYSVATDNAGNVQPTPNGPQATVRILSPLGVTSIAAVSPNPRNAPVSTVDVTFSEPINTASLSPGALTLTDNGGANLINSGVSLALVSGDTYAITGLSGPTVAQGQYTLTINAADIQDQDGIAGTGSLSVSWLMDTTAPTSSVINSLGSSQATDTFSVPVSFNDPGGASASGVSSLDLYVSINNGPFTLYQTLTFAPTASGTETFTFTGQDRNTYAFHALAHDAAGNTETKGLNATEATTSVPDLNPPVTHVISTSPAYSWNPFPSANFAALPASTYTNGVFTINWAGADPDQSSGTPAGSIALVNIYVVVDGGAPVLIGPPAAGSPNGSGVYCGSLTYNALADGVAHTYAFYSTGVDDLSKKQAAPASADATFSGITYSAQLAVQQTVVEKGIAGRSYIRYLDVDFNQSLASPGSALQPLATGLAGLNRNSFVELLWYGENLTAASVPQGSVNLFNAGTTATVALTGNDLSIDFGPNGITGLLTEMGVAGTGSPTKTFGDGWYALGIDPTGNPADGKTIWQTFFRLLGDVNGNGVVTGPYTTVGTDAYTVYHAEGQSGTLLSTDVDGSGAVNSQDFSYTVSAKGHAVGGMAPTNFPQFQLFAGASGQGQGQAVAVTQAEVRGAAAPGDRRVGRRRAGCRRRPQAPRREGPGRRPGHEHPGAGGGRDDRDQPDGRRVELVSGRGHRPDPGVRWGRPADGPGARAGAHHRPAGRRDGRRPDGHHPG